MRNRLNNAKSSFPYLSHVIGVMKGDGYVYAKKGEYRIFLPNVKDKTFAERFAQSLNKLFEEDKDYTVWESGRGYFNVGCASKDLCRVLTVKKIWRDTAKRYFREFLMGFFEAEGCLYRRKDRKYCRVIFSNTDREMLIFIEKLLFQRGIKCSTRRVRNKGEKVVIKGKEVEANKTCYQLSLPGKNVYEFLELLSEAEINVPMWKIGDGYECGK